jgi:putative methionine-R-sulfoxide reductase with GAF domain
MSRRKVPRKIKSRTLGDLEKSLREGIIPSWDPEKVSCELAKRIVREFGRNRRGQGGERYSIDVVFAGTYKVNPKNAREIILYGQPHGSDTRACSPIQINPDKSIIARAVITNVDQHIEDVTKDPSHKECSPKARHEEVYNMLSGVPFSSGTFAGYLVSMGVIDIDFANVGTLSETESIRLGKILKPYGRLIFSGEPEFELTMRHLVYRRPSEQLVRNESELRQAS